jgi:hypothetical protein
MLCRRMVALHWARLDRGSDDEGREGGKVIIGDEITCVPLCRPLPFLSLRNCFPSLTPLPPLPPSIPFFRVLSSLPSP